MQGIYMIIITFVYLKSLITTISKNFFLKLDEHLEFPKPTQTQISNSYLYRKKAKMLAFGK